MIAFKSNAYFKRACGIFLRALWATTWLKI